MTHGVDDELWSAMGDPTRRQMLDLLLAAGSGTSTSLSERLPVSRQAVAKHLAVLDRAGLVHGQTAGRERHYRIDEEQFAGSDASSNSPRRCRTTRRRGPELVAPFAAAVRSPDQQPSVLTAIAVPTFDHDP